MKDGFRILDSDMHLREPGNLWDKYMEPEWRERAPKILSSTARSSAMVMIEGKILQGYSRRIAVVFSMPRVSTRKSKTTGPTVLMPTLNFTPWTAKASMSRRFIRQSVWAS